jgi:hypothetical protein
VPAATWGTSQFRGCEWCRRDRDCPNPIIKELRVNPTLKFRSDRHFMCNPCSGSLRQSEPVLLLPGNAADKAKRKVRVKTNDEGYDSHCALVEKYEDQMTTRASTARATRTTTRPSPSAAPTGRSSLRGPSWASCGPPRCSRTR